MFMWIRCLRVDDTWDMIMKRALEKNVMLVPGQAFLVDQVRIPVSWPCLASSEYVETAFLMNLSGL